VPKLLIVGDDGSERMVELTERTLQIGRGPGNDIVLADASQGVSRTHAELRFRNGRSVIVDLQSQNGTWLNGQRVQHAEIPPDGEIMIGRYRLRVLTGEPGRNPASESGKTAALLVPDARLPDLPLVRSYDSHPNAVAKPRPSGAHALMIAAFLVAVAAFSWRMFAPQTQGTSSPGVAVASVPAVEPAPTAAAPIATEPSAVVSGDASATGDQAGRSPDERAIRPVSEPRVNPPVTVRPDAPPVARRPGESTDAWRSRTAAFQTRYVYSRAALDRGDFAAAAGGFEAILREEPGFLDVPQLLLRAQAGLRAAAVDVYDTGQRLENAGEWLGALQKYEQARQVHADIPGLGQATRRVREKLRVAGDGALTRARELEAKNLPADAIKEYEKAVQWLPPADPHREMAQNRLDQLKRSIR